MREYKFRGKRIDNGEWVYGSLVIDADLNQYAICGFNYYNGESGLEREPFNELVDPETVGQYTGLTDYEGTEYCDGDIGYEPIKNVFFTVEWDRSSGMYLFCVIDSKQYPLAMDIHELEDTIGKYHVVKGNRWDTPHLLEQGEKE